MDIQKEKKAIKGLKSLYMDEWDLTEDQKDEFDALVSRIYRVGKEEIKSQAIPKGFVLIKKECSDEMAEVIAVTANVCGGIAGDIYDAVIKQAVVEAAEGK